MKKFLTMTMVFALLAALPATALAQNGYYTWSVSESNTNAFANTGAVPGPGLLTLYLWFVEGCHPEGSGGMSAAEFKLVINGAPGWAFTAFTALNGFFETGPAATPSGKNFLMAVGACPAGPVLAGNILIVADGNGGRVGFTQTDPGPGLSEVVGTVDCGSAPTLHLFPAEMRCIGYSSAGPNQDHGQDCNVTPVESGSWGQVKGLYR